MATRLISDSQKPTPRQLDVLRGVALGLTNRQIAFALGLRPATVRNHLARAYDRLLPRRSGGARGRKYRLLAVLEVMKRGVMDAVRHDSLR